MNSRTIAASEWRSFADRFSRAHEGWAASLEVREGGDPQRVEVDDSLFRGATIEHRQGREMLVLTFGDEPEEHFAHIIHGPRQIVTSEEEDCSRASLLIESSGGDRCVLALTNPLREEDLVFDSIRG